MLDLAKQTVLVVDDDPKIRALLRNVLEGDGFGVVEASGSSGVRKLLKSSQIDLVTLDLALGSEDGFELAREIRRTSRVPIIMVTGKGDVIDRVVGLEVGADDYITKPFHVREVIARVRCVLRRASYASEMKEMAPNSDGKASAWDSQVLLRFDRLTAAPQRMLLIDREGEDCGLTSGDFRLLNVFLERPNRVLSRDQLMDLTGGQEWTPLDRTIDNQIARLRKKIERDPSHPQLIKTVRGIGYLFAAEVQIIQSSGSSEKSA